MTKAVLYRNFEQYDSAIYYAGRELLCRPNERMGLMVKAQSFSLLGMKDSAVFYARKVTEHSPSWSEQTNAYYILSNDDETLSKEEALKIASDRADAQKMLETQRSRLAQAVLLLQQDMDRKPDYKWLYAAILTALLMTALVAGRHIVTRKKHAAEKRKRQEDTANYNRFLKQAETLLAEMENTCTIMRQCQDIKTQLCWNDYGQMCRVINKQFSLLADRLGQIDGIHETDIRLCVLVLIGFSLETIADILPCSPNSVKTLKRRTALKLGTNSRDLRMFLLKMAANMPV
jgi:DNA-binding CsgD family transcriptional regulator